MLRFVCWWLFSAASSKTSIKHKRLPLRVATTEVTKYCRKNSRWIQYILAAASHWHGDSLQLHAAARHQRSTRSFVRPSTAFRASRDHVRPAPMLLHQYCIIQRLRHSRADHALVVVNRSSPRAHWLASSIKSTSTRGWIKCLSISWHRRREGRTSRRGDDVVTSLKTQKSRLKYEIKYYRPI